jgi:hypothetical protein
MGGRALKAVFTRRCNRAEFDDVSIEIINQLQKTFNKIGIPRFYNNKESFGDIDIVVSVEHYEKNMRLYILDTFKPIEIFHNGNCWSFDYKELQIDIITTSDKYFDSMLHYMSMNDLGNFIGRLAHGLGLKYGQESLFYEHQFKNMNIGTILISQDYSKIYEFLGLDYSRWEKGFDELEDIFEYIATSKYFNWKMFQLDQLNKINRDRNAKRKSYMSFLEWIDANVADDAHVFEFAEDKTSYFMTINDAFPEAQLITQVRRLEYLRCRELYIQSKFNGGEVMRRFGLNGKALGDALNDFKGYIIGDFETFEDYVITCNTEDIYKDFGLYLKHVKQFE